MSFKDGAVYPLPRWQNGADRLNGLFSLLVLLIVLRMAIYRLKDETTLIVDHALMDKYQGIATAMRDNSEFNQMPLPEFMPRFAQAYRQVSNYPLRYDTAEHFVLDLFLDGYIMVLDGSRG